jgi:D-xylose 1-dehydrogenase (NADP+, D-xylono-1,5-lactone-forming)
MVRWGILGTAQIAKVCVIPAILKSRNGVLKAIASRDLVKSQALVEKHHQGVAYAGYAALLEDPEIDAVYIPLPNHLHKEWTIKALEAGKHVLVEKPFAMNAGEAEAMAEAAQHHNRLVMEAFMYRFHPRSQRIKQLVDEGALGKISLIHSAFTFPVKRDGSNERLFLAEMGGGSLWDVGCYGVSVARWMLGEEPTTVSAQANYDNSGVDTNFIGILRFASGALAVVESSFTAALQQTFSVTGDSGAIELPHNAFVPWEKDATYTLRGANDEHGQIVTVSGADEYQLMVEHFADALQGNARLAIFPGESINQMRILDALARAARLDEIVEIGDIYPTGKKEP